MEKKEFKMTNGFAIKWIITLLIGSIICAFCTLMSHEWDQWVFGALSVFFFVVALCFFYRWIQWRRGKIKI